MDGAFSDVALNGGVFNVPLRIGDAGDAIRVRFDGACVWRTIDTKIMCPYFGGYHEGNSMLLSSSSQDAMSKQMRLNADGTLSPAAAPDLVLGLEATACGVAGNWISQKDGVQTLRADDRGFARSSDGFMATLTRTSSGNKALLRYEWGESFLYTLAGDMNLTEADGYVVWTSIRDPPGRQMPAATPKLRRLIQSGCIACVKGAYLEWCVESGRPYEMRQHIPESFLWSPEDALALWEAHGHMFLLIWSYGWLTPTHPDPHGYHLSRFDVVLQKIKRYVSQFGVDDVAVVIDYCALWQKDGEPDQRTDLQMQQFKDGLSGFTDLYVHRDVTAVKLTAMPEHEPRLYTDRGWTLAESLLIDAKAGLGNRLVFDSTFDTAYQPAEGWAFYHKYGSKCTEPPLTPADLVSKLEERRQRTTTKGLKLFVNDNDMKLVPQMYADSFRCIEEMDVLCYPMAEWGDDEVSELCKVLILCKGLKKLSLNKNFIGNDGVGVLCETLLHHSNFKRLRLDYNNIGKRGAKALVMLIRKHSSLRSITVNKNPFCKYEDAVREVKAAWEQAGKDIRKLSL